MKKIERLFIYSGVCIAVGHVAIARAIAEQLRKGWSPNCLRAIGR